MIEKSLKPLQWVRTSFTKKNLAIMQIQEIDGNRLYTINGFRIIFPSKKIYTCDILGLRINEVIKLHSYNNILPNISDIVLDTHRNKIEIVSNIDITCKVNHKRINLIETQNDIFINLNNLLFICRNSGEFQ